MHSLEVNASPDGHFLASKCRRRSRLPYCGCFSRYCWSPYIPKY